MGAGKWGTSRLSPDFPYETTYTYSSSGYSDCGSGGCSALNLVFPTLVTNATTGLTIQFTWDATGGVKLTEVGPNGVTNPTNQKTIYGYDNNCGSAADPFWRVGSVTDPVGNELCVNYLDSSNEMQSLFSFNSGNSVVNSTLTVGRLRPHDQCADATRAFLQQLRYGQ